MYQATLLSLTNIILYGSFSFVLTQRIKLKGETEERRALEIAAAAILKGNIISLPTETFYALSTDPFNLDSVNRIFQIKKRPDWKALLLLIESVAQAQLISENIPSIFFDLAENFWPGPLTLILPAAKNVPLKVTGGTGTVGIRVPAQTFTCQVIRKIHLPIIGTSANLSGYPPCSTANDVLEQLGGKIELLVDSGSSKTSAPSTVIDLTSPSIRLLREGAIPKALLQKYLS